MGGTDRGPEDPLLFRDVRRFGVVALVSLVFVLGLADVVSEPFRVDPIVLGLLLAGALLFAGRDPGKLR